MEHVSWAEFELLRAVYQADPWDEQTSQLGELSYLVSVGHGLKFGHRKPRPDDFRRGRQPGGEPSMGNVVAFAEFAKGKSDGQ